MHSHITLPYNRQLKFLKSVNKTLLMHSVDFEEDFEDSNPKGPGNKLFMRILYDIPTKAYCVGIQQNCLYDNEVILMSTNTICRHEDKNILNSLSFQVSGYLLRV